MSPSWETLLLTVSIIISVGCCLIQVQQKIHVLFIHFCLRIYRLCGDGAMRLARELSWNSRKTPVQIAPAWCQYTPGGSMDLPLKSHSQRSMRVQKDEWACTRIKCTSILDSQSTSLNCAWTMRVLPSPSSSLPPPLLPLPCTYSLKGAKEWNRALSKPLCWC